MKICSTDITFLNDRGIIMGGDPEMSPGRG